LGFAGNALALYQETADRQRESDVGTLGETQVSNTFPLLLSKTAFELDFIEEDIAQKKSNVGWVSLLPLLLSSFAVSELRCLYSLPIRAIFAYFRRSIAGSTDLGKKAYSVT
jgi:hypothetical protein